MKELADEQLVEQIRDGNQAAFGVLVERHSGRLFGIAVSMLRNEQDALDVVQETFLNVHRRLDSYRGDAPFGAWLRRVATNNALMKLRTRRRKPETSLEVKAPGFEGGTHERDIIDLAPLADKLHEDAELGQAIREAVDALPEGYRTVLLLADYHSRTMKEIAEELALTVPNVKTRLHRARLSVRESLQDYLTGER